MRRTRLRGKNGAKQGLSSRVREQGLSLLCGLRARTPDFIGSLPRERLPYIFPIIVHPPHLQHHARCGLECAQQHTRLSHALRGSVAKKRPPVLEPERSIFGVRVLVARQSVWEREEGALGVKTYEKDLGAAGIPSFA